MTRRSALRSAARVPKIDIPVVRFELSNGATLLVSPRTGAPVTAVHAHFRGGPSLDPDDRAGTAYLTGALADQGTSERSEEELVGALEPAGGEISGDASGLHGTIVTDQWPLLVDLFGEILRDAAYPKREVARHRGRLLDRLRVEAQEPRAQGRLAFRELVYGDHWLGRAPYGSIETVERIEPRNLRSHHRKYWVARRGLLAVCGDVDPQAVRRRFERALRGWTAGELTKPAPPSFPARGNRVRAFPASRQQVHVYLGHLGVERKNPDWPALVVMDHVLGTGPGFTNRISRTLRDEQGLAYTVSANIHGSAGILPGTFTAYIGTSPDKVPTAVAGFLGEIRRIQDEPVGADELETAKSYLIGSYPLGFERASRRAGYMIASQLHGFPPDHLARLLQSFAAVDAADVQRVAQAHLFPDACCLAAAGPVDGKTLRRLLAGKS